MQPDVCVARGCQQPPSASCVGKWRVSAPATIPDPTVLCKTGPVLRLGIFEHTLPNRSTVSAQNACTARQPTQLPDGSPRRRPHFLYSMCRTQTAALFPCPRDTTTQGNPQHPRATTGQQHMSRLLHVPVRAAIDSVPQTEGVASRRRRQEACYEATRHETQADHRHRALRSSKRDSPRASPGDTDNAPPPELKASIKIHLTCWPGHATGIPRRSPLLDPPFSPLPRLPLADAPFLRSIVPADVFGSRAPRLCIICGLDSFAGQTPSLEVKACQNNIANMFFGGQ